jgi:hypothetical protein
MRGVKDHCSPPPPPFSRAPPPQVKKTVNPDFHEVLGEVEVVRAVSSLFHLCSAPFPQPSRVKANMVLEVFDWDSVGVDDKLGQAVLDLADLEPFESTEKTLRVTGKGASENGTLSVKLVFRPEFIATRGRKGEC